MSMSRKQNEREQSLWVSTQSLPTSPGHPFYERVNRILAEEGFDRFAEDQCERFYKAGGRPSIPPGVYFRMLLLGYFEGLDSERGIAWRCADSLGLRDFLGYDLSQQTPDHSSLSVIRRRLDLEVHQEVFGWVLAVLRKHGLIKGKTVGIDATTLEANAALRSIVRRDDGQSYEDFLKDLARSSGIETPTRADLAKLDRNRPKKGSNKDWYNPHDPDARITKMKDGRTHLAHKEEHAVDMDTGAVLGVTIQGADQGDTSTMMGTLAEAARNTHEACADDVVIEEVVADKGYHSNDMILELESIELRTYISEPDRGRRNWKGKSQERDAVYANRRRIRGDRGRRLLRRRGEFVERPFAHCFETGGMRRTHLRGHENILKRLLVHVAGCNLGLLMRKRHGNGTPREAFNRYRAIFRLVWLRVWRLCRRRLRHTVLFIMAAEDRDAPISRLGANKECAFSTGC